MLIRLTETIGLLIRKTSKITVHNHWKITKENILVHAESVKITHEQLAKPVHQCSNCGFCIRHYMSEKLMEELQNEETQTNALAQIKKALY